MPWHRGQSRLARLLQHHELSEAIIRVEEAAGIEAVKRAGMEAWRIHKEGSDGGTVE